MATSFSVANLTTFFPRYREYIQEHLDDKSLRNLTSPEGITVLRDQTPTNVRVGWLKDESQEITGIFFSFVTNNMVEIQKISDKLAHEQPNKLTILTNYTGATAPILHSRLYNKCFSAHKLEKADAVALELVAGELKEPETIREFCAGNREMLPTTLRNALMPRISEGSQEKDASDINPRNVALVNKTIVLGMILFTVIYFAKPIRDTLFPKVPPVKPEGLLPVKALA
ncbi:MAG: hypothetical protein HRU43_03560 [Simkaniaceae bacterium]|nr:hypothetical protein [Simkaniaceae bacterium]